MTTPINEHNMLTLDFWRDTVTYEGKTVPTGTLGCETLNIPDEVIEKLSKLCPRVNLLLETMNQETPNAALLPDAGKAAEEILTLLRDVPPFHRLDMDFYLPGISKAFTSEGLQAYSSAKLSGSLSTKQLEAVRLGGAAGAHRAGAGTSCFLSGGIQKGHGAVCPYAGRRGQ